MTSVSSVLRYFFFYFVIDQMNGSMGVCYEPKCWMYALTVFACGRQVGTLENLPPDLDMVPARRIRPALAGC